MTALFWSVRTLNFSALPTLSLQWACPNAPISSEKASFPPARPSLWMRAVRTGRSQQRYDVSSSRACRCPMNFSATSVVALMIALALCFAAAALGARVTTPEIPTWYASLAKPSWTPPRAAFPIVWPILYLLMAVSVWLLWQADPSPARTAALVGFAAQLLLNTVWSPVFFGRHDITGGLVIISLLAITLTFTVVMSFEVDWIPGALLVPYLFWISFAAALNFRIWTLN